MRVRQSWGRRATREFYPFKSSFYALPGRGGHGTELGGGKQMWTGFFSSAHVGRGDRPLMNIDGAFLEYP